MIREHSVRLPFRYAAGEVGSRYLSTLREGGPILATPCEPCGAVLCPARASCPRCGGPTGDPVAVGPGGALVSWTEVPGKGAFGLILLDGADTPLLHRLVPTAKGWSTGARVRPRWAAQRHGSVRDLEGFEEAP